MNYEFCTSRRLPYSGEPIFLVWKKGCHSLAIDEFSVHNSGPLSSIHLRRSLGNFRRIFSYGIGGLFNPVEFLPNEMFTPLNAQLV